MALEAKKTALSAKNCGVARKSPNISQTIHLYLFRKKSIPYTEKKNKVRPGLEPRAIG